MSTTVRLSTGFERRHLLGGDSNTGDLDELSVPDESEDGMSTMKQRR